MSVTHLAELVPVISPDELVTGLALPPRFGAVRFQTYRPDPAEPTQAAAVRALVDFTEQITTPPRRGLFRKASAVAGGYYLDGGRHHAHDAAARAIVRRRGPAGGDVQHVARQTPTVHDLTSGATADRRDG